MAGMSRLLLVLLSLGISAQTGDWREPSSFTQNFWVRNAASSFSSPEAVLAPGSRIIASFYPGIDVEKPYSLNFEDSTGVSRQLSLVPSQWFVSNSEFEAILPDDLPGGEGKISLVYNEGLRISQAVQIVPHSFGLYGIRNSPQIANVQNISSEGVVQQNGFTTPAHPGNYLTLWGTGLGAEVPKSLYVVIGGREAKIVWAGKAPTHPGIDQINVYLDPNTPWKEGCFVPVRVRTGGVDSPVSSIAIANEGACQHPYDLSLEELQKLDRGEAIPQLSVYAGSTLGPVPVFGGVSITDERTWMDSALLDFSRIGISVPQGILLPDPGTCMVSSNFLVGSIRSAGGLDAGESIDLQGPGATVILTQASTSGPLPSIATGLYRTLLPYPAPQTDVRLLPPPIFREGVWTLKAQGGVDVAAFERSITIPPVVMPTNLDELKFVDRTASLPVRWNPTGYAPHSRVIISIGNLSCIASAQAGEFLISSGELKKIDITAPAFSRSIQLNYSGPSQLFSVPLTNGGEIRGVYQPGSSVSIPTTIR